jgi:CRP/FNR family cyclic AMP-dependent transcriptional regulator
MVGESLFIVKSGTVKLTQKTAEGERELAVVGAGEHLGELALLAKSVRLVSAVAATPCEVLEITQRDFVRIQPQKPQACLKLALAIAHDVARKAADSRDALREMAARKPGP